MASRGGTAANRPSTSRAERSRRPAASRSAGPAPSADAAVAAAPDEPSQTGRIGIYSANFGEVMGRPEGARAITALAGVSAAIVCVQETTIELRANFEAAGRMCTDEAFAGGRREGGDGLVISGLKTMVKELITHSAHSGSWGAADERSSQLAATAIFRQGLAGCADIGVLTVHTHRGLANRGAGSPRWREWCVQLGRVIRECRIRVITGDLNMALYVFAESMAQHSGLMLHLLCHHREVSPCTALAGMDDRGVRGSMRHDSCGIWLVGGIYQVLQLSTGTRTLMGAMHPALLTQHGQGRFKAFTRGFALKSYTKPSAADTAYHRACEVPSEEDVAKILQLWAAHEMTPMRSQWVWEVDLQAQAEPSWQEVAAALPKTGEALQARLDFQALLAGMGIQRKTDDVTESMLQDRERFLAAGWIKAEDAPTALAGVPAPAGQRLDGRVQEVAPDFRAWDEHGYVWGRPGHYPLWVMLGPNRIRSADGDAERAIRKYKTQRWRAGGSWPWWIYHESEKWYWLAGAESSGRGHTGYWWRRWRERADPAVAQASDAEWARLYGEAELRSALAMTGWVLELAYPPVGDEAEAAASGEAMEWPARAFSAQAPSQGDVVALQRRFQVAAPMPTSPPPRATALAGPSSAKARAGPTRPPMPKRPPPQ